MIERGYYRKIWEIHGEWTSIELDHGDVAYVVRAYPADEEISSTVTGADVSI